MTETRKFLFAEDDYDIREEWIQGLLDAGFVSGEPDKPTNPESLIEKMETELIVLRHSEQDVEVHLTANELVLNEAVEDHTYELCFMDNLIFNEESPSGDGNSHKAIGSLVNKKESPHIVLISGKIETQIHYLEGGGVNVSALRGAEKMSTSTKRFGTNRALIEETFGISLAPQKAVRNDPKAGLLIDNNGP